MAVLDLEVYVSGQTVSIDDWNALFAAIKAANLLVSDVLRGLGPPFFLYPHLPSI